MSKKELKIDFEHFEGIDQLPIEDQQLCGRAEKALETAYAPYSRFRVGTAIALEDGKIVLGSNQENVAYPSGLCAERVALFQIGASDPEARILAMAITAHTSAFRIESPVTSCGACLQVMAEFEKKQGSPIAVLFYCRGGAVIKVSSIQALLPFGFVEERLGSRA